MNYRANRGNRVLRKRVLIFLKNIHIKIHNFHSSHILILIGLAGTMLSLFLPWFEIGEKQTHGSFNALTGYYGFLALIVILISLFILLSFQIKQKIKSFAGFHIHDHSIFLILSWTLLIEYIHNLILLKGMYSLVSTLSFFSGIILAGIGSLFFFTGSLLFAFHESQKLHHIILEENNNREWLKKENVEKNTTKLPF